MEVNPKDIVWKNLDDGALEMKSRYLFSWVATAGLIIAWAFPVSFIGSLSNLSSLCEKVQYVVQYHAGGTWSADITLKLVAMGL